MTIHEALNVPRTARFTTEDFMVLVKSGAFENYARAELIKGEIYVVNAQFRRHAAARRLLARRLEDALVAQANTLGLADECSVDFGPGFMPQPDITVTSEPFGDGPIPLTTVKMIVEIADTTLEGDLGQKLALYADHHVPEYWVVDLKAQVLHQFWMAEAGKFRQKRELRLGEIAQSATIFGLQVDTRGI